MGCNCGGQGSGTVYQLVSPAGKQVGTYLTRTEAIAAMSAAGGGHRVVTAKT